MRSKRNELNKQIIECRSQLSNVCASVLLRSIHAKIQALNSKLFHHLEQTKKHKLENLTNPRKNSLRIAPLETKTITPFKSQFQKTYHFQTLKNLFLAKASTSFPYPRKATNSLPDKMSKNFFAAFSLKHFSITKKTNLTTQKKMPSKH